VFQLTKYVSKIFQQDCQKYHGTVQRILTQSKVYNVHSDHLMIYLNNFLAGIKYLYLIRLHQHAQTHSK